MLTVTAHAAEELKAVAEAEGTEPDQVLRLVPAGSGMLTLVLDTIREGDQVVEHEGGKVLLVGAELADAVDGLMLDAEHTAEGCRLVISGPTPEA